MRRFTVYRQAPPAGYLEQGTANSPDEPQFQGVVFDDGTVCVRWMTAYRSHSIWASLQDLMAVHGHPEYGTRVEWHDDPPGVEDDTCKTCGDKVPTFGPFVPMDLASAAAALDALAEQRGRRWK